MLKEWILKNVVVTGKINASWAGKNYSKLTKCTEIYNEIINYNNGRSIKEKLYMIVNDIDTIPICVVCNKNHVSELKKFTKGFINVCSVRCANKIRVIDVSNKLMEKYGVSNVFQLEHVKQKIQQTNLERYGTKNVFQSEETKKKIKQTNLERYGVEVPIQNNNIHKKIKQTCLERYGTENASQSKEIRTKVLNTLSNKYGVTNISQLKETQDKIKHTCFKKYGAEHSMQNKDIKNKIQRTNKCKRFDIFKKQLEYKQIELVSSKNEYINNSMFKFKCLICR